MRIFENRREFENFFSQVKTNWIENKIEYKFFGDEVLIVVPHAGMKIEKIKINGKFYSFSIGEKNVGELAKIAAYNKKCGFLISYVPRVEADFARDPNLLGFGLKLKRIGKWRDERKRVLLKIHRNKNFLNLLLKFHSLIKSFNPKFIISFHGMFNRKFDILLGFGKNKKFIGGVEKAFKFRKKVKRKLKDINLKIGISKRKLLGEREFILSTYTKNRPGVLVEFNLEKRKEDIPSISYQIASIFIAETAKEWIK